MEPFSIFDTVTSTLIKPTYLCVFDNGEVGVILKPNTHHKIKGLTYDRDNDIFISSELSFPNTVYNDPSIPYFKSIKDSSGRTLLNVVAINNHYEAVAIYTEASLFKQTRSTLHRDNIINANKETL